MQSGGSLPELWVPFQRLPEPSMLGEGGPPMWRELDMNCVLVTQDKQDVGQSAQQWMGWTTNTINWRKHCQEVGF